MESLFGFFESENIVELFHNVEEIIGLDIERILIESQRRATYDYVANFVPSVVKKITRFAGLKMLAKNLLDLTRLMGHGDTNLVSIKYRRGENDHVSVVIRNPWFLESFCGLLSGGMEAVTGLESDVSYEEVSPGTYRITTYISKHPMELAERLREREYPRKQGEIELRRCITCGGPKDLEQFAWNIAEGTIETRANKRRMVLVGPGEFEPIFDELEHELGEHIPNVIIEAQRRSVTEGFYSREDIRQENDLARHFALRGLGNMREVRLEKNRLYVRLENPCLHLIVAGLLQGFYELIFAQPGDVEWELRPDGDLIVDVCART